MPPSTPSTRLNRTSSTPTPSLGMFHRRLLLLGVLLGLGFIVPIWGLRRSTIDRGDQHREKAESYLVMRQWLPTGRGRILDRAGRILAEDRPSFDVAVDYSVITGEWAYTQAYRRARRIHKEQWPTLSRAERRRLAEESLPDFEARLDAMWDYLAQAGRLADGRAEIDARLDTIKKQVQTVAGAYRRRQLTKIEADAAEKGIEVEIDPGDLSRPVAEETRPHVILRGVDDQTAFRIIRATLDTGVDADDLSSIFSTHTGTSSSAASANASDKASVPPPLPGVTVEYAGTREYPGSSSTIIVDRSHFPGPLRSDTPVAIGVNGVATHIVGWMRHKIFAEDNAPTGLEPIPRLLADGTPNGAYYLDTDSIGSAGIERAAERTLRGVRGLRTMKLDTSEQFERPPVHGGDVTLTIDSALQAAVQALLTPEAGLAVVQPWHTTRLNDEELPRGVPTLGEQLAGAVVVIEVDTGDVLAMVSSPSFTREELRESPEAVYNDRVLSPAVNRAISQPYAPGSIVKPLVLCAAVTQGAYKTTERIACTGHFLPNEPDRLQCWAKKQFQTNHTILLQHDPDGSDAIMASCNIFFYEMGRRLGLKTISSWFEAFGVGEQAQRWELGLGYEYTGDVPKGTTGNPSDAFLLGIGQGPIAWTPLHAADAYATLARAGIKVRPRLLKNAPAQATDLRLDPLGVEQALRGLERAATEDQNSTAHHITIQTLQGPVREVIFNVMDLPGIHVWAKSGTADASAIVAEDPEGRRRVVRDGDHAWCVLLCGDESSGSPRPKYAVAVVADYGGSGGRVSGPIANQVVWALVNAGYLKPSPSPATKPGAAATPAPN